LYTPWRPPLHSQAKTTAATSETSAIVTPEMPPEDPTIVSEQLTVDIGQALDPAPPPFTLPGQEVDALGVITSTNGGTSSSTLRPEQSRRGGSDSHSASDSSNPGSSANSLNQGNTRLRRSSSSTSAFGRSGISVKQSEPEDVKFHPSPPSLPTTISIAHVSSTTTRTKTVKRKQVGSGASVPSTSGSCGSGGATSEAPTSPREPTVRSSPYKQTKAAERLINVDPSECLVSEHDTPPDQEPSSNSSVSEQQGAALETAAPETLAEETGTSGERGASPIQNTLPLDAVAGPEHVNTLLD
jgi:hypothetical protein